METGKIRTRRGICDYADSESQKNHVGEKDTSRFLNGFAENDVHFQQQ